jgi:hypothetical protein
MIDIVLTILEPGRSKQQLCSPRPGRPARFLLLETLHQVAELGESHAGNDSKEAWRRS